MSIAVMTDPNDWVPLVTALGTMFTAIGVVIHAILSAWRSQKLNVEVVKNSLLTLDVSGKADIAATAARDAAGKVQHITDMVNSRDSKHEEERKALEAANSTLRAKENTAIMRDAVRDAVKDMLPFAPSAQVATPAVPVSVVVANPDHNPVPVTQKK